SDPIAAMSDDQLYSAVMKAAGSLDDKGRAKYAVLETAWLERTAKNEAANKK
ncbi:hypothetical protein LCGC14_3062570, partial [marine sediment metagenome]